MDAETRIALDEFVIAMAHSIRSGVKIDESGDVDVAAFALQRLLDEKGGDSPAHTEVGVTSGLSVAGAASTAPPDSLAKIAADLEPLARRLEADYPTHRPIARAMRAVAARIEALALEPSERDGWIQVRVGQLRDALHEESEYPLCSNRECSELWHAAEALIAALTPIAERVEAREFKPDIESMEFEP